MINQLISGVGNLFNDLFRGLGTAPQAASAPPQRDSLLDLFAVRPDLGQKYGASYAPPEPAYTQADVPLDAMQAAITAPFTAPAPRPATVPAPVRNPNRDTPPSQFVSDGRAHTVASDHVAPKYTSPELEAGIARFREGQKMYRSSGGELEPDYWPQREEITDSNPGLLPDARPVAPEMLTTISENARPAVTRPLSLTERVQLQTGPRVRNAISNDLGAVSAKYESGGRGVEFISSGKGDPGGRSYGIHQLSGAYSMGAFLRSPEGAPFRDAFKGLRPTTNAFNKVYRRIAKAQPEAFAAAQRAFYTRTHFDPLRKHAEKLGFDVSNRGVQEALFSMSVQHGRAKTIVSRAGWAAKNDVKGQIRALYDARTKYVSGLSTLPSRTKRSVLNRYQREVLDALSLS